ncbi:MAG TPA: 4-alpha-glucanotransferase, partial [Verrucomicrobiae bacterium]|nr:4-alpha-glucanotransferase [Verrucomicrobiae bacterium]
MNLTFRIRFATHVGQSLWLVGGEPFAGQMPLQYRDPESWELEITLPAAAAKKPLNYSYILRNPNGAQTTDWGRNRDLIPAAYKCKELLVIDSWNNAGVVENAFYTAPFKKVLLAGNFTKVKTIAPKKPTHTFRVKSPLLAKGQTVCLLGEGILGDWNTQSPILLGRNPDEDYFSGQLDLREQHFPLAYKYGVFDLENNAFVRYEDGANRILSDDIVPGKHTVVADGFVRLPANGWHGAGVAVPVFSLRTKNGFGVGEFADLKPLADWGKKVGLKLIQLLPVNDTSATHTWQDSYPYAAISAFALHPLYLNLAAVTNAKNKKLLAKRERERRRLNALDAVDYEAVMKAKLAFLRKIFPSQKTATFRSAEYKKFFAENKDWLTPYAAFCFLRDKFGTSDYSRWPEHNAFEANKISALARNNDDVAFHYFIQFHLHRQLQDATAHVHAAGLVLKGDIAIGVYRHGAGTWQQPELFHLDMQAGAPPDPFSATGQNWGFPTYNWPRMAANGFAWWKRRFAQMGNYFDAFRIDHILGFFRIWSNPMHAVEGILGHFVPAIPIEPEEFAARGIPFDRDRLTQPFITD